MHLNFRGLFNTKYHFCRRTAVILFNPELDGIKRFNTFLKAISSKVNVRARLEFELAYFKTAVQHFSPYATGM